MEIRSERPARAPDERGDGGSRSVEPAPDPAAVRACSGDRDAFAELYRRHASAVHAVLLSIVGVQEAQDLVQDVFTTALRTLDTLRDPARVGPWLHTIARNRGRDALRSPRRSTEPLDDEHAAGPVDDPDARDEAAAALDALRSLSPTYRETLCMRLVEGLSGPEIAERTGMTPGSVRVNLCRGMKLLRERLEELGW